MTSKNKKTIDKKPIEDLSLLLDELNLTEISYKEGDFAISVSRAVKSVVSNSSSTNTVDTQNQGINEGDYSSDPRAIKSPMVGTVYLQPEPGANTFVKEGDQVKNGQTLLIIEAMKTMNPIESTLQGKLSKILVENEQAVEFGQPLMLID
jgi:acetyl-CoA carboxylase biotin carboxyl carrier protein|tara:strand:- start:882 stop:1331 length:450 start_codon:yes stop_codon:yes gene_type:complete